MKTNFYIDLNNKTEHILTIDLQYIQLFNFIKHYIGELKIGRSRIEEMDVMLYAYSKEDKDNLIKELHANYKPQI